MDENILLVIKDLFERLVPEEVARRELTHTQKLEQRRKYAMEYQSVGYDGSCAVRPVMLYACPCFK